MNHIKHRMKAFFAAGLLVFLLVLPFSAHALEDNKPFKDSITQPEQTEPIPTEEENESVTSPPFKTPGSLELEPGDTASPKGEVLSPPAASDDIQADTLPQSSSTPLQTEPPVSPDAPDDEELPSDIPQIDITPFYDVIDANSVIVYTFAELKSLIGQNNGYTTFYLGADIVGELYGAPIHASKNNVVIDGHPPTEPAGTNFSFTDYSSASFTDTIYIAAGNTTTKNVTIQNMRITGKNYYGPVSVESSLVGVTLNYNNIQYTGPQLTFNRQGTAHYHDTTVSIVSSSSPPQELGEVVHAVFSGNFTFTSVTHGASILWLTGLGGATGNTVTVQPNANVQITTPNYFIYNDAYGAKVSIGQNATFSLTFATGFNYDTQYSESLTVEPGATCTIKQTGNYGANPTIRLSKSVIVQSGGNLEISRTTNNGPAVLFNAANAQFTLNSPGRVLLYSPSNTVVQFLSTGTFYVTATGINLWTTSSWPPNDTISNMPSYRWNKAADTDFTITATYNSALQFVGSNYAAGDFGSPAPSTTNFRLNATQLFVAGSLPFQSDSIYDNSVNLTGSTSAGATVRATYTSGGVSGFTAEGNAFGDGTYSLPLGINVPTLNTDVSFLIHYNYLKIEKKETVQQGAPQVVSFIALPSTLPFQSTTLLGSSSLVSRQDTGWTISIGDTRVIKTGWRLGASITQPLTATTVHGIKTLPNALVYVDSLGTELPLSNSELTIYSQAANNPAQVDLSWAANRGLLLQVPPGAYASTPYSTTIHWTLYDAP